MTGKSQTPQNRSAPPAALSEETLDTVAGGTGGVTVASGDVNSTTAYKPILILKRIDKSTP